MARKRRAGINARAWFYGQPGFHSPMRVDDPREVLPVRHPYEAPAENLNPPTSTETGRDPITGDLPEDR